MQPSLGCINRVSPLPTSAGRGVFHLRMPPIQLLNDLLGRDGNHRSRSEDGGSSVFIQIIIVLGGNNAADNDHDVFPIQVLQFLDQLRQQGLEAEVFGAHTDDVSVVFHGLFGDLARGLEEGADVDVEAQVGEGGGDDLGAAIVSVLTDLGDHHARSASFALLEALDHLVNFCQFLVFTEFLAVDATDGTDGGFVTTEDPRMQLFESAIFLPGTLIACNQPKPMESKKLHTENRQ